MTFSEGESPKTGRNLPEPPDLRRVAALRARLRRDRSGSGSAGAGAPAGGHRPGGRGRDPEEVGRRARDIGTYTIIPMMMIAGPAIGYLVGLAAEKYIGAKPWPSVAGILWGLVAAFRQIYLLLKRREP